MVELNTAVEVKTGESATVEVGIRITEETAADAAEAFHVVVKDLKKDES